MIQFRRFWQPFVVAAFVGLAASAQAAEVKFHRATAVISCADGQVFTGHYRLVPLMVISLNVLLGKATLEQANAAWKALGRPQKEIDQESAFIAKCLGLKAS